MLRNFNETARYVEQGGGKRSLSSPEISIFLGKMFSWFSADFDAKVVGDHPTFQQ